MSGCFRYPLRVALLDCVSPKTGFLSGLCLACYQGKIASGIRLQDSVNMALIETGSNHNDSGIGRTTDESVKADDSSEQETLENYSLPQYSFHHSNGGNLSLGASGDFPLETAMLLLKDADASSRRGNSNFSQDLREVNRDFEQMHLQCLVNTTQAQPNHRSDVTLRQAENQPSGTFLSPPKQRIVPRMGTRRDFCRQPHVTTTAASQEPLPLTVPPVPFRHNDDVIWVRSTDTQTNPETNSFLKMIANYQLQPSSVGGSDVMWGSDRNDLTSAYNTGNSCCSTPVLPQKVIAATSAQKPPLPPKAHALPTPPQRTTSCSSSKDSPSTVPSSSTNMASQTVDCKQVVSEAVPEAARHPLRSLQKLYTQYVDVMYTNHANLEHTIMVQQKLFSQQLQLNSSRKRDGGGTDSKHASAGAPPQQVVHPIPASSSSAERRCSEDPHHTPMEWVVKRRSDGSRYIARRPLRNQILKDRAQRLAQERSGVTTDDDAASEMKLGRYWSRDKRKLHLESARFHRQQKELLLQRRKMETVRENYDDHQPNIIELSRRKAMRHKSKRLLVVDGFTTVQELLAHGNNAESFGRSSNPLLSVTTV